MIKLSRLSTVKNLTRLALGGTLGATLIITASKPSEAAVLSYQIITDTPSEFRGFFILDNSYDAGSTSNTIGNNWKVSATETFSLIPGKPTGQAVTLTTTHQKAPHGEGPNVHPDLIFARFENSHGTQQFKHESHFNIRTYNYAITANPITWRLDVHLVHTPEPTSVLSLFALGTLGAASTLKRKLKPCQSTEKETTKVG